MSTFLGTIFTLATICCPLYAFPYDQTNYHGTLRVIAAFDNGFVVAADGKGSALIENEFKQIKSDTLRDRLMHHKKLFTIGNNLCAAFGGQVLRDADSMMLPEGVVELFKEKFSIGVNTTLDFTKTATELYTFFYELYYKQPKIYQVRESSIFLAGIDDTNNLALILVNSPKNQFTTLRDALLSWSNFKGVLRHGPYWKEAESTNTEENDMRYATLKKIQEKIPLNRMEATDYTLWIMKICIEKEIKNRPKEDRRIDYPIDLVVLEKNKPIEIKIITK